MLGSISIEGAPPSEIEAYLAEDFERFLLTWNLVRDCTGTALEIGANPYFTTVLLREFTDLDITLTNSFDPAATGTFGQRVRYTGRDGESAEHEFRYESLNVEVAAFPYADESFDVVLFCEVIEHLLLDPVFALREINRILKPGGRLALTTPNVARLENVARLVAGANMYDPYSGYGPYGRHNREFTRHELVKLLSFCGFATDEHFTADVHPHHSAAFTDVAGLAPALEHRLSDLGQYLFCSGTKCAQPRDGRPHELFRSMAAVELVSWD